MISRRLTLAAGAALIVVANALVLTGVAINRSGEPESRLVLSEREIERVWNGRGDDENSGIAVHVAWRSFNPAVDPVYLSAGKPQWLDERRLAELGLDVSAAERMAVRNRTGIYPEREVMVVLELAGPEWQRAVQAARENLTREEGRHRATPSSQTASAEKEARDRLAREEHSNSRLFVVDAGLDLDALRAKYPDRSRYMIMRSKLHLYPDYRHGEFAVTGSLGPLLINEINVPHAFRPVFQRTPRVRSPAGNAPISVTLAVGRRLEPWIENAAPGSGAR